MLQVTIVGSGLSGLAAALFLARRGHRVHVLERDADDLRSEVAGAWFRRGVGQASQTHAFLARSSRVMAEEAPDVLEALESAGAYRRVSEMLACDEDPQPAQAVFERRLAYEAVLRRTVEEEPNARMSLGCEVTGLLHAPGEVPHVKGVATAQGDFESDLVIDASGRRSPCSRWLAAIGARPPVHESHPCGFFYLTRWYKLRSGAKFPDGPLPLPGRTWLGSFILCAAGNGQFSISLGLSEQEPQRHALRDPAVFDRFVAQVPRLEAWMREAEGLSEPQAFAGIENGRRKLVDANGPVVTGYVLLGDAAMHTNPTLGRGVSLAFSHAQQLAKSIELSRTEPARFIGDFEKWTEQHLGEWFDSQVAIDNEMTRRFRALARSEPLPELSAAARRMLAMQMLAMEDRGVAGALTRMMHLLKRPSEIAADEALQQRIALFLADKPGIDEVREGVTRAEFTGWLQDAA